MRRVVTAVLAALALTIGAAAPVSGQENGVLEINPTEGSPGDLVHAFVDPEVVDEQCITTIEETQALFVQADPFGPGPVSQAWLERGPLVGLGTTPSDWVNALFSGPPAIESQEAIAALFALLAMSDGIGADPDLAAEYMAETFVLTFADIETQDPVGETSTFDPSTGFGEVVVPDVAPGLWAVAATCVEPLVTDESFLASVAVGAEALTAAYGPYPDSYDAIIAGGFDGFVEAAGIAGEAVLPELMVPQEGAGPWTETFCVDCDPPPSQDLLDQFCGVLPEIQAVPDQLAELFGGVDIDDPNTYPSVEAVEAFVTHVATLLELGDTSVPPAVAPQWSIATEDLRDLVFGLTAVGFDFGLLVDLSPEDAQRLLDAATGEGDPNPEFDAAVEVLTAFFLDNCVPGEAAPPTAPTAPVARFTG